MSESRETDVQGQTQSPPDSDTSRAAFILALQESSRQILAHDDFKETAYAIYHILKRTMGFRAGYVALLSRDGQNNELLFLDAGDLPCSVDRSLPMPVRGMRGEAYQTGQVVYHNHFPESPWADLLPPEHARLDNVLFAPLKIKELTVGVLGLANKPGGFSEQDAQLAGIFGELSAVALANIQNLNLLRDSEEHFRAVALTAQDAIVSTDGDGRIVFWNKRAAELFGFSEAEAAGQPITIIIPERLRERHCEALKRVRVTGIYHLVGRTVETVARHRDGHELPVELSLSEWVAKGEVHFSAIIRDISERKRTEDDLRGSQTFLEQRVRERTAELTEAYSKLQEEIEGRKRALEALGASERKFRAIFNQTFQFIGLLTPKGRILEINQTTLDFLGRKYHELIGIPLWEINPENTPSPLKKMITKAVQEAAQGRFVRFEFPVAVSWDETRTIDFSLKPVLNDRGSVEMLIPEGRDITERKQVEEALRESEARLRLLSTQVLRAQENERKRIAKELHDGIGQYLSAIKYRVEHALAGDPENPGPGYPPPSGCHSGHSESHRGDTTDLHGPAAQHTG